MRSRWGEEEAPNFWPAVADVFIGFLALLLIAGLIAFATATRRGEEPPPAKREFKEKFEEAFAQAASGARASDRPKVTDEGFSEVSIYFPAKFLFDKCHTDLKTPAVVELTDLKNLFRKFDDQILRVQITGHTDSDPIIGGLCYQQGIRTNWELSARRAITVLELLAPDDGSGLDPRKVWAAALGEYHPAVLGSDPLAKERNRRIEVLVRFREKPLE
jgi:outer membrane protein OmpA-like peptidoglycan-associated protein